MEMMRKKALLMGLKVCEVPAYGNCLPESIALQRNKFHDTPQLDHVSVRADVVAWLRVNREFPYQGKTLFDHLDIGFHKSWEVPCPSPLPYP